MRGKSSYSHQLCFVCLLPLFLVGIHASHVRRTSCDNDEDREIMKACLFNYTEGFLNLDSVTQNGQPPSCEVDLGLARCLDSSNCFGNFTNGLRKLIFNQLVFTKKVRLCPENDYDHLLVDAMRGFPQLNRVKEMEKLASDPCAFWVYVVCGIESKEKLESQQNNDPKVLCDAFVEEKGCITNQTEQQKHCDKLESPILNHFQQNSNDAAHVVLSGLACVQTPKKSVRPKSNFFRGKEVNILKKISKRYRFGLTMWH
ncbi:uncharacterized protein [Montipora capricornis]|uniref:uncharacterized protein n=1 Tax=Montipora capricornis TaxID=246305 RepID=UPI0035F20B0E